MPWIVGIDEAGYGPNLGPFIMSSVACHIPAPPSELNLWRHLKTVVRRPKERRDGRLLIEDSKVVYSSGKGLKELERGVLAALRPIDNDAAPNLTDWLNHLSATAHLALSEECWFTGTTPLPVEADAGELQRTRDRFHRACQETSIQWYAPRSIVVCPARFNGLLERWGSKSIVLLVSLAELLQHNLQPDDSDSPVHVFVDKHGGRNSYTSILQQAVPAGEVVAVEEGIERSVYRIDGLQRPFQVTFQPRADGEHFCVALASMSAKYLRELLMGEFNAFWRQHLPDLKPTAGYPVDATRFMEEIRATVDKLGLDENQLWRRK